MEKTIKKKPSISDLVTVEEYAAIVSKTRRTVYNWISEKRLPTHSMFGKTLINKHDRPVD